MDKPIPQDSPLLAEAVRRWTGWRQSAVPIRDDAKFTNQYDEPIAAEMLLVIKSLEKDFYSSDARLHAANIFEMGKLASEDFKRKHPAVADDIVKAFEWCYTFDFK